jgi:hypothetical protein
MRRMIDRNSMRFTAPVTTPPCHALGHF